MPLQYCCYIRGFYKAGQILSGKQMGIWLLFLAQENSRYYLCKNKMHIKLTREQQRFWKRILIVDGDNDITTTFKATTA